MGPEFHEGQRLSFEGALCTVRYAGTVQGTSGDWLGVEWDDPTRGKHSGEHRGVRYFKCKSKHSTAGSFVRPSRPADKPRGFLEALHEKYASEFEEQLSRQRQAQRDGDGDGDPVRLHDLVYFGSKVAEEVGFEKIRKQLAELAELKIVLLDGLRIAGVLASEAAAADESEKRDAALADIARTCPKIVELDLSRNLLRRWVDVWDICRQLKQLRLLKLNGNRFDVLDTNLTFDGITELHLDEILLSWDEIAALSHQFPSLTSLSASTNQISTISTPLSSTIRRLTLENNEIETLASIRPLTALPNLERLSLRGNDIRTVSPGTDDDAPFRFPRSLRFLDVSHNRIGSWTFVNALPTLFPGLESLRISDNPLYDGPAAPSSVTGHPDRPMTMDEAFMLTLARLASVTTVNYSRVSPQDRTNGELYYLSLIGKELSAAPETQEPGILARHPRYRELCDLYGPPAITRAGDAGATLNPRSLAARLVTFRFYLSSSSSSSSSSRSPDRVGTDDDAGGPQEHTQEIPRTFDTYRIKALVSRVFGLPPLRFRLVWETEEWDPVDEADVGEDEWDSSAEEDAEGAEDAEGKDAGEEEGEGGAGEDGTKLVKREVELVDSTRQVGFLLSDDLREARVRVEVLADPVS
ncbi:hypothetical protein VTN02DRAFT_6171 [Thermoascus thermophilus]